MSDLLLPPELRYADIIKQRQNEDGSELSTLNLGPTHPATHGIFQNILLMDGERIVEGLRPCRGPQADERADQGGRSQQDASQCHAHTSSTTQLAGM